MVLMRFQTSLIGGYDRGHSDSDCKSGGFPKKKSDELEPPPLTNASQSVRDVDFWCQLGSHGVTNT